MPRSWAAPTYSPDRKPTLQNTQAAVLAEPRVVGNPFCDGKALFDFSLSMFELLSAWLIK